MDLFLLMRTNVDSASGRLCLLSLERLPEREKVDSALASCGKSLASRLKSVKWRGNFSRTSPLWLQSDALNLQSAFCP